MLQRPPRSTLTYTLIPYTKRFRSWQEVANGVGVQRRGNLIYVRQLVDAVEHVGGLGNLLLPLFDHRQGVLHRREGLQERADRKSTRQLQSLMRISYAVFCLKKTIYQEVNYK